MIKLNKSSYKINIHQFNKFFLVEITPNVHDKHEISDRKFILKNKQFLKTKLYYYCKYFTIRSEYTIIFVNIINVLQQLGHCVQGELRHLSECNF